MCLIVDDAEAFYTLAKDLNEWITPLNPNTKPAANIVLDKAEESASTPSQQKHYPVTPVPQPLLTPPAEPPVITPVLDGENMSKEASGEEDSVLAPAKNTRHPQTPSSVLQGCCVPVEV